MNIFLNKYGCSIERIKGKKITNFIQILIHTDVKITLKNVVSNTILYFINDKIEKNIDYKIKSYHNWYTHEQERQKAWLDADVKPFISCSDPNISWEESLNKWKEVNTPKIKEYQMKEEKIYKSRDLHFKLLKRNF